MALANDGLHFRPRQFTVTGININEAGDYVITLTSTARTQGTAFAAGASTVSYAVKAAQSGKLPTVGQTVTADLTLLPA
jgi:hypothetical protein